MTTLVLRCTTLAQLVAPLNGVKAYFSVGSTNKDIEERQRQIEKIFESKKIHYEVVDVTTAGDYEKQAMRQVCKDLRALPPQIANDGEYCGDFNMFEAAVQKDDLDDFLKLRP